MKLTPARNQEVCTCRDPWDAHDGFVWAPPPDGQQHWPQEILEEDERTNEQ